jgi:hypothetical protein
VDLIEKLLQLNPNDRLGAGPPGSMNDYAALKAHPYFKGMNFNTLDSTFPPLPQDRYQSYFYALQKKISAEDEAIRIMGKPQKSDVGNSKSSDDSVQSLSRQPTDIMNSVVKQQ